MIAVLMVNIHAAVIHKPILDSVKPLIKGRLQFKTASVNNMNIP